MKIGLPQFRLPNPSLSSWTRSLDLLTNKHSLWSWSKTWVPVQTALNRKGWYLLKSYGVVFRCKWAALIQPDFNETQGNRPGQHKNDPEGQRTRSGPELRRNRRFYVQPKSGFWPKNGSYPKKSIKMTFSPLIIWAKATFFFEQLFPVVARTWLGEKSVCLFLGPKFRFLAKKSDFCHTTPILVDDPFLALGMTVNFPPWKPFFDFPFRS